MNEMIKIRFYMKNIPLFGCEQHISALFSESQSRKIMSAPNKTGDGGERKKKESILDLSRWVVFYNIMMI